MSDVFTKAKRSEVMSRIRGRGNRATELAVAQLLRAGHVTGWRRHLEVPGRPDFAFQRQRLALFVDGCFWHQCPRCSNMPATNRSFWLGKLTRNVARDREVDAELLGRGWNVLRIWEHEIRRPDAVLKRIVTVLAGGRPARARCYRTLDPRRGA